MVKTIIFFNTDVQGRKYGQQHELDTQLVRTIKYDYQDLENFFFR